MKKWVLFGGIAFLIVIILATLVLATFNRDKEKIPAGVVELSDTWRTINHPTYGVSFEVPIDWKIRVFEYGMGFVSGFFGGDTTAVYLNLNLDTDSSPKIADLLKDVLPRVGEEVNQGGLIGISYVGRVVEEGNYDNDTQEGSSEIQFSSESYVVGRHFIIKSGVLKAECMAVGQEYSLYIPTCEEVLNSIRKI